MAKNLRRFWEPQKLYWKPYLLRETAEESLKVVQAELEANKSSLAQALSDQDSACQVTGKMKEDITELMNEISDDEENLSS